MSSTTPSPPPWEVVILLSHRLDPRTLAIASCVSRSWSTAMSSDDLWRPICHSHFPTLSSLLLQLHSPSAASPPSCRLLFAHLLSASPRRRPEPSPLRLALSQLTFAVDVFHGETPVISVVKRGHALKHAGNAENLIFRFDMGIVGKVEVEPTSAKLRAVWGVLAADGSVAVLVDSRDGAGRVMGAGSEVWFSEELPPPACCSGNADKGQLVAELGLRLEPCEEGEGKARMRATGMKVGLMSTKSWRYVRVDDGLRYLQHFFVSKANRRMSASG